MKKNSLATIYIKTMLSTWIALLICFSATGFAQNQQSNNRNDDADDFEMAKNLEVYHTLMRELRMFYVDPVDMGKMVKTSIVQMLLTLDPYTNYYPESDIEDYRFMTTGEYGGIGAMVIKNKEDIIVSEVYEKFPAQKADIRPGDILLEIQGQALNGKTIDDVSKYLKGQPNQPIKIKLKRPGINGIIEKQISCEHITISSVPYHGIVKDKIGYIKLTGFTENVSEEFKKALVDLLGKKSCETLIIDLRGNPGGLLLEAVNIVNLFVDKGQEVVSMRGKVTTYNKTFVAEKQAVDTKIPIVVLVDRGSASASEIVSGALQDLDRAVVIGQRTFGKGLVQATRDLVYNSKLKLTTAKYYIPSGRCIQALDYTHRNEDGSVGKIPDSLITAFKTKNGRMVYDGGGIQPDITTEISKYGKVTNGLIDKLIIFDYATLYRNAKDSLGTTADKFSLNEEEYKKFAQYAKSKDIDYATDSEKLLEKLIQTAKDEKYFTNAEQEIDALRKKLITDELLDLQTFKPEIIKLLNSEIVSRFNYNNGRIQNELSNDSELNEAIKLLSDLARYNKILTEVIKK